MGEYGYSVLLVDDEPAIRTMLRRWLARRGMSVCAEAATGEQALTAARLYRPGTIVLDDGLPDIPGTQLLPHLRRLCPDAWIVLFTADQAAAHAVQATGAAAGLVKGGPLADLHRALTAATDHAGGAPSRDT